MDILIYSQLEKIKHKLDTNVNLGDYCYWIVGVHPDMKKNYIKRVYFSDGKRIIACGEFVGIDYEKNTNKKCIYFYPLTLVNKKQPRKPPLRGWCYIKEIK